MTPAMTVLMEPRMVMMICDPAAAPRAVKAAATTIWRKRHPLIKDAVT